MTVGPQWPYWMPASTRGAGAAGVDRDRGDLLREQVRPVHRPGAAVVVTAGEPQPLARPDGQQVGHGAPPRSTDRREGDRRAGDRQDRDLPARSGAGAGAPTEG